MSIVDPEDCLIKNMLIGIMSNVPTRKKKDSVLITLMDKVKNGDAYVRVILTIVCKKGFLLQDE